MSRTNISLDVIRIEKPCPAGITPLGPHERNRHCATCDKSVHNFTAMRRNEVELILRKAEHEPVCVQFERDREGRVVTRRRGAAVYKKFSRASLMLVSLVASLVGMQMGCGRSEAVDAGDMAPLGGSATTSTSTGEAGEAVPVPGMMMPIPAEGENGRMLRGDVAMPTRE